MKRGSWHQCGDRSQKLVQEQLESGLGVGAVISPRDVSFAKAQTDYAPAYHDAGAEVLVDPQFYLPEFSNARLETYPIQPFRLPIATLAKNLDDLSKGLTDALVEINLTLGTHAIIAPAIIYEAGRRDINSLNLRLLEIANEAGQKLGRPTYSTVFLGRSITSHQDNIERALAEITASEVDGWYFGFEFGPERVPSSEKDIFHACAAGITLAQTEAPILHAFAGPLALLSFGFGATGAGVGHSQNLWSFSRSRWQPSKNAGGGGDAPPRFFSTSLWGTIIFPDETEQLSAELRSEILTTTKFSSHFDTTVGQAWSRWDAGKHLVAAICSIIDDMAHEKDLEKNLMSARQRLERANELHQQIRKSGIYLKDNTNAYQSSWIAAIDEFVETYRTDLDFIKILS